MLRVRAYNINAALASDYFALLTNFFGRSSNLHNRNVNKYLFKQKYQSLPRYQRPVGLHRND